MTSDPLNNTTPQQPLSPEEDPALLAIEALEARETDLDRPPVRPTPRVQPRSVPRAVAEKHTPLVIEPVPSENPLAPPPIVKKGATPVTAPVESLEKTELPKKPEPVVLAKVTPPAEPHWKHSTDIVEVLADAPAVVSSRGMFRPFANQVRSHKELSIVITTIIILGLGAIGYFVFLRA